MQGIEYKYTGWNMTLWVLSTQWLAVVYTHKGGMGGGRWAGWYNRQYPDLGRVDMSYG